MNDTVPQDPTTIEARKLQIEESKLEIEREKLKVEQSKERFNTVLILLSLLTAMVSILSGVYLQTAQIPTEAAREVKSAIEVERDMKLKILEIVLNEPNPEVAIRKVQLVKALYPRENFEALEKFLNESDKQPTAK